MNILLIEPDHIFKTSYAKFFKNAGHDLYLASNADEALAQINNVIPDVILLNLELTKHSAFELVFEIRSYADLDKTSIILISNFAVDDIEAKFPTLKSTYNIKEFICRTDLSLNKLNKLLV